MCGTMRSTTLFAGALGLLGNPTIHFFPTFMPFVFKALRMFHAVRGCVWVRMGASVCLCVSVFLSLSLSLCVRVCVGGVEQAALLPSADYQVV